MSSNRLCVLTGTSHPQLAKSIVRILETQLGKIELDKFANDETRVRLDESVCGDDVFIIQTSCGQVNDKFMELLLMIYACKMSLARRVTVVIPHFPYARQDRTMEFSPISSKLIANMLTTAGADLIITLELHAPQLVGFFNIPVFNLSVDEVIISWIKQNIYDWRNVTLISPDAGGAKRILALAHLLNLKFALIHKERAQSSEVSDMTIFGNVSERPAVIIDDIADTCGTILTATRHLLNAGATKVYAIVIHGLFSGSALQKINESHIEEVVTTNSVPQTDNQCKCPKLKCIDISNSISEAIRRIHMQESVTRLSMGNTRSTLKSAS